MTEKHASYTPGRNALLDIRKIFLTTLTLGVVGIIVPQAFDYNMLSVFLPLLFMAAYVGIGYRHSQARAFLEQFADSVYYQGFLFTLIALVISLYHYRGGGMETESIIANFSLALITTIFGLAVRITITNFQVDLHSAERQMLQGVEQVANDFVRKAKTLSMQLELSHDETQRAIQRAMDDAALGIGRATGVIEQQAKISSQTMLDHTKNINDSVADTLKKLEQNINNVDLPQDIFSRQFKAPIDALIGSLNETRQRVSELTQEQMATKIGFQTMTGKIERMNSVLSASELALSDFNNNLATQNRHCGELVTSIDQIGHLINTSEQLSEQIREQVEHSTTATLRFKQLLDGLAQLPEATEHIAQKLQRASDDVIEVFAHISGHIQHGKQIGGDMALIAEATAKTQLTVKQISDFGLHVTSAFKRLEAFNQAIELYTQNLAKLGDLANSDITMAAQHQQELAAILEHSRTTLAMLNRHFVDSINYVSDRLQD
ncbi:MAG: hypothetical protein CVV13_03940 [Gammaproteobacteria bacterium HGW-Gammaproteobacteria-3]|nr:MAG: hypothetical protein CVV13_03940 [Gammaproteobacteria bacterium HGW-Gammaproteobacteria-3]